MTTNWAAIPVEDLIEILELVVVIVAAKSNKCHR